MMRTVRIAEKVGMISEECRIQSLEESLRWIRPLAKRIGVTRVADVTALDSIGLPVYQAIRPRSKNYKVSQGKGLTPQKAELSALMESIEMYHAEQVPVARLSPVNEIAHLLSYRLEDLERIREYPISPDTKLEWVTARNLLSGDLEFVPRELISMDFTVQERFCRYAFRRTSNGLASGNCREEALLHGLYEVIERDCLSRSERVPILPNQLTPQVESTLERIETLGLRVEFHYLPNDFGLPCFEVILHDPHQWVIHKGSGCHPFKQVALIKALTEAIQSRLTMITGSRDDLRESSYSLMKKTTMPPKRPTSVAEIGLDQLVEWPVRYLEEELKELLQVLNQAGFQPLAVDLMQDELKIPVCFVLIPGLQFKVRH